MLVVTVKISSNTRAASYPSCSYRRHHHFLSTDRRTRCLPAENFNIEIDRDLSHPPSLLSPPNIMCDYIQREYSCRHFRWIASKWCRIYTITHRRCPPNITHYEW